MSTKRTGIDNRRRGSTREEQIPLAHWKAADERLYINKKRVVSICGGLKQTAQVIESSWCQRAADSASQKMSAAAGMTQLQSLSWERRTLVVQSEVLIFFVWLGAVPNTFHSS